jgi:hypothetical protein
MAGALTRRNAPPGASFSQQGQVDWVGLANHSVSFTVGVLSRLSKAGVDPLTVVMGRTLFRNMSLSKEGQERVFDALSSLKSFSSFGQVLWFGFGVRHVVHEITGTEEGMTCVAISAALQVSYNSLFAAEVFRELSQSHGAPDSLLPALHQWRALVEVSAGVLTASKFPRLLDGFARILAPPQAKTGLPQRLATTPTVIAQALSLLADVATGRTASCTFAGGIDCAWVAAVAEWLYCLTVEILSEDSSETHYRSSADLFSSAQPPRILIIKSDDGSNPMSAISKAFILPSGRNLLIDSFGVNDRQNLSNSRFERRSEWAHLLTDIFGEAIEYLLQGQTGENFAYLVRNTMNFDRPYYMHLDVGYKNLLQPDNETFSYFAGTRLPELKSCLDRSARQQDQRPWDLASGIAPTMAIKAACGCRNCTPGLANRCYSSMLNDICLRKVASTILCLLKTLYNVAVDPNILPSHFYIVRLYYESDWDPDGMDLPDLNTRGPDTLTKIFAEKESSESDDFERANMYGLTAYSTQGLCAYYHLLEDPNLSPKDAARIHILPGCIEYRERQYSGVEDLRMNHDSGSPFWSGCVTRPSDRVDFIVQETAYSDKIGGAYRLIQSNTPHVQKSIPRCPYYFPVLEALEYANKVLQFRCLGNICSDSSVIRMKTTAAGSPKIYNLTSWSLPSYTADSIDEERPEERPILSQEPASGQQRQVLRRTTPLSLLISTFFAVKGGPKTVQEQPLPATNSLTYKLEIHKFPVFSGIDGEGDCSTPSTFARLYAELVHGNRGPRDDDLNHAIVGDFDDCVACLIKITYHHLRRRRLSAMPQGDITGNLIRYLANGEQQSTTGFALKSVCQSECKTHPGIQITVPR